MKKQKRIVVHIFALFLFINLPLTILGEENYQSHSSVGFYGEYKKTPEKNEESNQEKNIVPDYQTQKKGKNSAARIPRLGDNYDILFYRGLAIIMMVCLILKQQDIKKVGRVSYNV